VLAEVEKLFVTLYLVSFQKQVDRNCSIARNGQIWYDDTFAAGEMTMTNWQWPEFLQTRIGKILFRTGVVFVVVLLILYIAYCAASVKPGFYRQFEAIPHAERKKLNDEFMSQVLAAYSQVQESDKFALGFTDRQFNGWLSVDGSSNMFRVLPSEIKPPRLAIRSNQIEIVAPVMYRPFSAMAVLSGTIRVPEPGVIAIRFRSARLGIYPFDKEKLVDMVKGELDKPDWDLEQTNEGGDPVLSFRPKITIEGKFALTIESFQTDNEGQCSITGRVSKIKRSR
jgi:hypothetical protein